MIETTKSQQTTRKIQQQKPQQQSQQRRPSKQTQSKQIQSKPKPKIKTKQNVNVNVNIPNSLTQEMIDNPLGIEYIESFECISKEIELCQQQIAMSGGKVSEEI
eukprot:123550_1